MREMIYELCICKGKTIRTENAYSSFKALDRIKKNAKTIFPPRRIKSRGFAFHSGFFFHWPSKEMS